LGVSTTPFEVLPFPVPPSILHRYHRGHGDRAELLPLGGLVDRSDYPLTQATGAQRVAFCGGRD